jgi:glycosyltransferase involved in cell wall biosynthesis
MGAALAARCPLIVQLHGTGFDADIRWFLARAAAVCVPCEATRAWVRSVSRSANTVIVPPPVALEISPEQARPNLVLFLGRLEASKGLYDLLEAIARLRSAVPDVRLACAGDGDRIGVARYAERLGIADAVKFTGWVGPSGKRALLEHAAVFALPSYDEAMPVSLAEAMSAGVPVVATPVGGIPEVVVDGANGYLVAPGDKAGLERALRRLLLDRPLAARLGAAAREAARRKFAPERALSAMEQLYESVGARAPRLKVELKKAA